MTREEERKQASKKYFDDYLDGLKGEVLTVYQTFEDAAKWADETMIEKACEWLKNELFEDIAEPNPYYYNDIKSKTYDFLENFIEEFCKAMKGE